MITEHNLFFSTKEQAKEAMQALSQFAVIPLSVQVDDSLFLFTTTSSLGPIMRGLMRQRMQPKFVYWNCQPETLRKLPIWHRIALGQVLLTLGTLVLAYSVLFLVSLSTSDGWSILFRSMCLTALVAWLSSDILILVRSCFAHLGTLAQSGLSSRGKDR